LTFDAFDRMVEQNRSGTYTEIVYAPTGDKLALMSGTGGQTLQKALILLPGRDTAIYTSSGLDHYRHSDWLGSARLTSTASRTASSTIAYAPFGETYAQSGTTDPSFTGQNADTVSTDYDFVSREYSNEGRWPSPDPAGLGAAHSMNPQSWNRYAYVLNNPLSLVDPFGLDCIYLSDDETSYYIQPGECSGGDNGYYVDGTATVTANSFNADGQLVSVSVNGSDQGVGSVSDYSVTVNDSDPGPEVSSYAQEIGRELAPLNRASDFVGCTLVSAVVGDGGLPPPVTHILFEGASKALENPKAATLAARAYYTATDARFTAFGKFSKVLVPRMAASLRPVLITAGETVSVAGWVVLGYEVYRAGSRCAKTN